jgi:hypothetical protein
MLRNFNLKSGSCSVKFASDCCRPASTRQTFRPASVRRLQAQPPLAPEPTTITSKLGEAEERGTKTVGEAGWSMTVWMRSGPASSPASADVVTSRRKGQEQAGGRIGPGAAGSGTVRLHSVCVASALRHAGAVWARSRRAQGMSRGKSPSRFNVGGAPFAPAAKPARGSRDAPRAARSRPAQRRGPGGAQAGPRGGSAHGLARTPSGRPKLPAVGAWQTARGNDWSVLRNTPSQVPVN